MSVYCERYFTERLFWLPDTDDLLHVYFTFGYGWAAVDAGCNGVYLGPSYTELMQKYFNHRNPELLLQEEI